MPTFGGWNVGLLADGLTTTWRNTSPITAATLIPLLTWAAMLSRTLLEDVPTIMELILTLLEDVPTTMELIVPTTMVLILLEDTILLMLVIMVPFTDLTRSIMMESVLLPPPPRRVLEDTILPMLDIMLRADLVLARQWL